MIDPLSISASIAALLQVTGTVIKYLNGVKNAPDDLKRLSLEMCTLLGLLSTLQDLSTDLEPSFLDLLDGPSGVFAQLESLLEQLTSRMGENSNRLGQLLHWPLQRGEIKGLLSSLERQKSSLSLILQNNQRTAYEDIIIGVSHLRQGVNVFESALQDARNSRMLRWLGAPDPSSNHNAACAAHSPTTGNWLLTSDAFKFWWANPNELLWIYGLPGCGKSVLASTIIEHASALCEDTPHRNLLYFYFDFREEMKQTVDGFLRSLLVQLACRCPEFPPELQDLYTQCESKHQQPTNSDLIDVFISLLGRSQQTYLIIDALDECSSKHSPEREGMLSLVKKMKEETAISINVLILSRAELDIEKGLRSVISHKIGIQDEIVDADIRVHVRSELANDARLKDRSPSIKAEIETSLVDGAHGMFRWVVCQIDVLRQCRRVSMLRDALKDLPEDLDATYDRILSSIPKRDHRDAVAALQLLAVSNCAISVADVAEAVVVDRDSCCFDPDDRLPDHFDIVDVLSSLVTCSSRLIPMGSNKALSDASHYAGAELATEIRLAHYSVKEYIMSDRIRQGKESCFYISQYEAQKSVAEMCLTYLLQFDQVDFVSRDTIRDYPFCLYAAEYWFRHTKVAYDNPCHKNDPTSNLTRLCIKLLSQENPSFINWLRLCDPCNPRLGANDKRTHDNMGCPLYYACYAGLLEISRILRDQGVDLDARTPDGRLAGRRPLNGAILGRHEKVVSFLLESGVNVNAVSDWATTALHQAILYGDESIVESLLRNGALLELKIGPVTPYSQLQKPVTPIVEACNPTRSHTQRAKVSIALRKYLLQKQMYLESNHFNIASVEGSQTWGHGYVLATLMYGGDRAENDSATGRTALHEASWSGRVGMIDLLLDQGADIECKTRYGWTAILFAAWNGHTGAVRDLINKGAAVDVRNVYGWTPLHAASARGHESTVRLLLDRGADIEAETSYGWTPLFGAVPEEHVKTLALLLERGANPDTNNSYGGTALHRAARAGSKASVSLLLQKGASRSIKSVYGTTAMQEAEFHGLEDIIQKFNSIADLSTGAIEERQDLVSQTLSKPTAALVRPLVDSSRPNESEPPSDVPNSFIELNNTAPLPMHHERALPAYRDSCNDLCSPSERDVMPASSATTKPISILFVCRSNLCRSPMAEAVFRSLTKSNPRYGRIDSAGTPAYHEVAYPDPQTMKTLKDHDILDYDHVMKKIPGKDFAIFDYILTVGTEALPQLQRSLFHTVVDNVVEIQGVKLATLALFGYFVGEGVVRRDVWNFSKPPSSFEQISRQVISFSKSFIGQVRDDDVDDERMSEPTGSLVHASGQ